MVYDFAYNERVDPTTIRKLRKQLRLRQEDLGRLLRVRQETVSDWERGLHRPSCTALANLSRLRDAVDGVALDPADDAAIRHCLATATQQMATEQAAAVVREVSAWAGLLCQSGGPRLAFESTLAVAFHGLLRAFDVLRGAGYEHCELAACRELAAGEFDLAQKRVEKLVERGAPAAAQAGGRGVRGGTVE
ncbi:MAG: helix-turn-helix domain-containing protein [Armatimonadetes bacterium]|nr:helix-turn-helix domain-containing protein [Armatimonadota bacterium]